MYFYFITTIQCVFNAVHKIQLNVLKMILLIGGFPIVECRARLHQ